MSKPTVLVSVDNHRCHRYGICQAEAPDSFQLIGDGRLDYERRPSPGRSAAVLDAARACPMRAIHVEMR